MASSSSTKKAAKLARKGSGRSVRFQGGTVFPFVVAVVLVLGLGLIVYGRQTMPAIDSSPPTLGDRWHAAYGIYLCDGWVRFEAGADGAAEEDDDPFAVRTGVYSEGDGIIRWYPDSLDQVGGNAVLGRFLEVNGAEIRNDRLVFPSANVLGAHPDHTGAAPSEILDEYIAGETKCDGRNASVSVRVWDSFTDVGSGQRYIANMGRIPIRQDGRVFAIYFGPDDIAQPMPPWADDLQRFAFVNSGQILPDLLDPLTGIDDTFPDDVLDGTDPDGTDPDGTDPGEPGDEDTSTDPGD